MSQTLIEAAPVAAAPPSWRDALPEDIRGDAAFTAFPDVAALAKSFRDTQAFVGADKATLIRLPKDGGDMSEVWSKLGRPADAKGYEFQAPATHDPAVIEGFRQAAHAAGLNNAQAAKLMEFYGTAFDGAVGSTNERIATDIKATEAALRSEWGAAYDDKMHAATVLVKNLGGQAALDEMNNAGMGRLPGVLKMLVAAADKMADDGGLRGGGAGQQSAMTAESARAAIAEKNANPDFRKAYFERDHAGHRAAVADMEALYKVAAA